jgi:hypothetical protein
LRDRVAVHVLACFAIELEFGLVGSPKELLCASGKMLKLLPSRGVQQIIVTCIECACYWIILGYE